ncbi:phage tail protein [uncultured Serratia sp.]|uniref:phage tail-collar fiber domain-containing protein n=1 Tax=uncultured Serratia sp. TaxID=239175 RepID=UPI00258D4039|nr:phage tail protein [uncultured Serratia sp.]
MSQTVITKAFVEWKAKQAIDNQPVVLDEFIFAYIPGLDVNKPIANTEGLPAADKIVHRQAVGKAGVVNLNAVVYSVTMGAEVGDFDFNWIGLVNKASGTLASIIHAPTQRKVKNANGQQGNVLTRSVLMEFNGAQTETRINVPAETWQIDFTARLAGMDEAARLANLDIYGAGAFFESGFLVAKTGNQYFVTQGLGYIGGLRAALANNQNISLGAKPTTVWADVCYHGTVTSTYRTEIKITVASSLADYSENGIAHYVFALASIDAAGTITDLRPKGSLGEQQANSDFLRKDDNLAALKDKAKSRGSLGLGTAATRNVGTGSGNVMEMGTAGMGVGPQHKDDAYSNTAQFFRVNATSANKPPITGNISAGVASLPCDAAPSTGYIAVSGNGAGFIGSSNTQANGVKWSRIFTSDYPPTAQNTGALPLTGGNLTGPVSSTSWLSAASLTASYHTVPAGAMPEGAGAYSGQLNSKAPLYQPNWQWPVTAGGLYVPIVKGVATRQGQGYPTAVSFGYLLNGTPSFAIPCVHAKGDNTDAVWRFDPNTKQFYSPGNVIADGAIFHTDGNITGNIWGGYLSNWLNNQFSARDNNINTRATWDYVNSRSAVAGGRNAWWYKDEVTGLIFQGGVVNRADHATWVGFPRGYVRECFGVQMTLAWTNGSWFGDSRVNIQARDVGNGGFNAFMDQQEQSVFWWAVGV